MIPPFGLKPIPQIIFGPGKLLELKNLIGRFGNNPLLVVGGRSFLNSAHYKAVEEIFAGLGLKVPIVTIGREPSPTMIDELVADPIYSSIDIVIAIGGGATLDAGKALSAMLTEKGEISRFLEGIGTETPSGQKLPFIAVPTTSGTGSEVTSNAVISTIGAKGYKRSLRHDNYIPDLALVDPALTLSCSPKLTAACAMDCFTQLVEAYLSTNGSAVTDALALDGIHAVKRSLRKTYKDGNDLPARCDLSYAALLSGIVLANAGLGTVHAFASTIGGLFPIPHGVVCGTLMAPANRVTLNHLTRNAPNHPALSKYATLGRLFSDQADRADAWYRDYFIGELAQLTDDLNIAPLSSYDISIGDIDRIVEQTGNKYNPAQLSSEELSNILSARI
ncbi:MAG: iron-containing alcohol dehydrogenase [Desulforhopalus sp.]